MSQFIGRQSELAYLKRMLRRVDDTGDGKALLMRGRRRVGKSRLVEEFIEQSGRGHFYFTAVGGSASRDITRFSQEAGQSTIPGIDRLSGFTTPTNWDTALTMLAETLPRDQTSVVVIDEVPYLAAEDLTFEGSLQMVFDRYFSKLPVLLILVGSDIAMMEKLNTYGRPFYQRGTEMRVSALTPRDVQHMVGCSSAEAFDGYLVTGGLPLVLQEWPHGASLSEYLDDALSDPTSALLVSGERSLAAEFPAKNQAREVLGTIGHGERTFALIGRETQLQPTSLKRSLDQLVDNRLVASVKPLSIKPSKDTRYYVDDSYLRFWLSFLSDGISTIERGRGDLVADQIRKRWTTWLGRAIEPVIRRALWMLAPDFLPERSDVVGGYWTRTNDPEIDIVAADREPVAKEITAVGSIKWLENKPFDERDLARLRTHRAQLPGAEENTPLIVVSRNGGAVEGTIRIGPDDLITAWDK